MSSMTTKDVKVASNSQTITLPNARVENDWQNEIESFAKPVPTGGSTEHRALNLNRVKQVYTLRVEASDKGAKDLNTGNGNITDKEDLLTELKNAAESGDHLTLTYGGDTIDGYITKINAKESASEGNSVYKIQMDFLEAVPMNS